MEGKTHRVGGVLGVVAGYVVMNNKGLLLNDVNPILQLAVMYPFAIYGSVVPDLDHNWNSVPAKDPISWCINRVLHLTTGKIPNHSGRFNMLSVFDAKHRSWQTHSIEFLIVLIGIIYYIGTIGTSVDSIILRLILNGFTIGVLSHLILDVLTPEGILVATPTVISGTKVSISLVPKSGIFATGGPWERLVRTVMWVIVILLFMYIVYLMCPYELSIHY